MTAPAAQTGHLRGTEPDIFNGDHKKVDIWKQQFETYWVLNDNHKVIHFHIITQPLLCPLSEDPLSMIGSLTKSKYYETDITGQ